MKPSAIAVALICCMLSHREAHAQNFWYVPDGYEYGYYYGLDFGNGVGFGYGIGVGVPLPASGLSGSTTSQVEQPLHPYGEMALTTVSVASPSLVTSPVVKKKSKPAGATQIHALKAQQPKSQK